LPTTTRSRLATRASTPDAAGVTSWLVTG